VAKTEKSRTAFVCQQCGRESPKWLGRCPECQEWNTLVETVIAPAAPLKLTVRSSTPRELSQVTLKPTDRLPLPLSELNRVLGGGLVSGSLVLIGGEPGIGKSTLLLQVSDLVAAARGNAAYITGEETEHQIKLRAERLGISGNRLFLLAETDLEIILNELDQLKPGFVVIDSIQTVTLPQLATSAGSVTQVRECTSRLMQWAKLQDIPVFISGHVTKSGDIAGPRILEHIVDVVLYFEGAPFNSYRLLRCVKNRFGSTNEVGVFEMQDKGLVEVTNPSQAFLSERGIENIGSVVVPVMEGNRPLLLEVQSLSTVTNFGLPRRVANGIDYNRLLLIIAVLSKRAGLKLGNQDIIVNVAGGLTIDEPAADLCIALSIASSYYNAAVRPGLAAVGELGLSGELRAVSQLDRRIAEVARLGFQVCLIPQAGVKSLPDIKGIEIIPIGNVKEAVFKGLVRHRKIEEDPGPLFEEE
jgi:DNA repair protein RadA/Sms